MKLPMFIRAVVGFLLILLLPFPLKDCFAAPDWCFTKSGFYAAESETVLDQASRIIYQGDNIALQKLLATGSLAALPENIMVYIETIRTFSGKAKVRPKGSLESFWTDIKALDCDFMDDIQQGIDERNKWEEEQAAEEARTK